VKGNGKISEYIEEESIWTGDDESVEDAQQDVWSISSDSLLIAVLDHEEENDIHLSDELLHFSMILSKGAASWYQSVTDARASNKWPHQYRGDLRTSQWRALKVAKMNGQTIRHFFNPVVSMEIYIRMDHPADIPKAKKRVIDSDKVRHMIISDCSDVEEITPLLIACNPATSTNDATITAFASLNSAQETIGVLELCGNFQHIDHTLQLLNSVW